MNSGIGQRLVDRLQKNNPFYLISAACMLGGCLAVTNSLSWLSIPIGRLLTLIVTLNCYEAMLIALGAYLFRRSGARRDAVMLLVLEGFFLVDVSFLNMEIATARLWLGLAVSLVLFAATFAKLAVIARAIGAKIADGRFLIIVAELAGLFALPIIFRWIDHDSLNPREFYIAWWCVGLLIPLAELLMRLLPPDRTASGGRMVAFYAVLPWLAITAHLAVLHYVYQVRYFGADAAPILLGLAIVMARLTPSQFIHRQDLLVVRLLLPAAAIFVSLNNPWTLCGSMGKIALTPTRLASVAAYLTYVYCFFAPYATTLIIAGACMVAMMLWGPTVQQSTQAASWTYGRCADFARRLIPSTQTQWGVLAIAAAFGFLGLGARLSLRKPPPSDETLPTASPPAAP
ncbi:MAG TPA: hypothetical protein VMD30_07165 [Tepidisphaeraceae bacterium]|nr:hypothetical protein [Tepidisphaeraceae bacterium]